ncbi:MAG: MFS transporter [Sphingomonas sp.]|jgi:MFS family permease
MIVDSPDLDEDERFPKPLVAWGSTGLLMVLFAMAYLDRQIVALMVKPISAEFGVGDFEISLLQGFAFAIFYAICALPLGMAVDRYPRRFIIMGGVLVWSLAAMACGLAESFNQLLFARVMVGAGEAALAPAAYSLLADLFPKRRLTFALSVFMLGATVGAELSLALGGYIMAAAAEGASLPLLGLLPAWRFAFIVTGAPGLIIAFLALLIHEPPRTPAPAGSTGGWAEVFAFLSSRKLFFFCQMLGFSLVMALVYARFAWHPTFLMRTFGWSITQASYTLATFGLVTTVFALLTGGRLVDAWFGRGVTDAHYRYYVIGGIVLTVCGVAGYLSTDPRWFFAWMVLPALPLAMGAIGASAVQVTTPPHLRGRVSAIYLLAVALIGMSFGPAVVGYLTEHVFGRPEAIGLALALTFGVLGPVVSVIFYIGRAPMRRAVAAVDQLPTIRG